MHRRTCIGLHSDARLKIKGRRLVVDGKPLFPAMLNDRCLMIKSHRPVAFYFSKEVFSFTKQIPCPSYVNLALFCYPIRHTHVLRSQEQPKSQGKKGLIGMIHRATTGGNDYKHGAEVRCLAANKRIFRRKTFAIVQQLAIGKEKLCRLSEHGAMQHSLATRLSFAIAETGSYHVS